MDNTQLEYFVEAMRAGSYRKAALNLYVSPQAIAQSIKRLEKELGIRLMLKHGRGIAPTSVALELFPYAERLVAGFSDFAARARSNAASHSERRAIRLGITEAPLRGCLFSKAALETRSKREELSLQFRFMQNEACKDGLREGLLDAAVIQGGIEGEQRMGCRYLCSTPLCVFSSEQVSQPELDLKDLQGARVAVPTDTHACLGYVRNLLTAFNVQPDFEFIENSEEALRDFQQSGGFVFGYGVSPMDRWDDVVRHSIQAGDKHLLNFYLCYINVESEIDSLDAFLRTSLTKHVLLRCHCSGN